MAPLRLLLLLVSLHLLAAADLYDEPGGAKNGALSFSHEPRDLVVARGQSARLDCLVRSLAGKDDEATPDDDDEDDDAAAAAAAASEATTSASVASADFTVTWYQDGELLHLPDARRHLLANGSLYFDKVLHKRPGRSVSDEGVYYCVAQQSAGGGGGGGSAADSGGGSLVSRNGTLQVAALARDFAFWPADTTVETGDSVRFGCWIESVPEAQVDWERDGVAVESVGEDDFVDGSRFVVLRSGALHIYDAREEDAGNYRCVAKNSLAGKDRKSPAGRLTVVPTTGEGRDPIFISPPTSSSSPVAPGGGSSVLWVMEASNATLECLVTGRPPVAVRWTINSSVPIAAGFKSPRLAVRPGFLTLTNAWPGMSGDYTCSATGVSAERGTNVTVTRTTALRVATAPRFVRVPQSQVFPTAKTVRFECEAAGTPAPDIRWLKDGRPLQIGGRIKNKMSSAGSSQLVLSNTVTQDSGIYQCQAQNWAGLVSASARLLVNITGRRPEPPSRLRAVPLSASELVLSWDPPRNVPLDDVTAYTVHYTLLGKSSDETQELALNNSHHVRQLVRNANYSFYVRAYIRKSASDPSEKFVFNAAQALAQPASPPTPTPSRPPSKTLAPTNGLAAPAVTLQPLNPTTLRVSWNKFPSPVSLYKILFRRHNKKEFDIEVVKGDILEYNITGLHPGRKYDVRVAPGVMNVLGPWVTVEMPPVSSDPSTTTTTTTQEPPAPPSNPLAAPAVELLAVNHSSVLVTWEDRGPASGRQAAQSVVLTYRIQGGRDTSQRLVLAASGAQWIGGLKAGNVYEFQLVATSSDGQEGPATTRTIRTLWETASGMENETEDGLDFDQGTVHLDAVVASSSEIHIKWKPVEHPDGVLFYTVRYVAIPEESPVLLGSVAQQTARIGYVRSTTAHVLLSNLTAHTLYQLSVRSHDREGRLSAFSTPPVERRTLADVPGAPSDVSWLITPEDKIQLTWRQPLLPNGVIISYAILISTDARATPDNWTIQEEPGSRFRAQLRNLTADVAYYVRMQARTSVGWGALTEPITIEWKSEPDKTVAPTNSARSELPAGVIIGLIIALCLTLVVVMSLMLTRRCSKVHSNNRPASGSPTAVSIDASIACRPPAGVNVANGGLAAAAASNGYPGRSKGSDRRKGLFGVDAARPQQATTCVEMEAFVPMLSTIPGDAPADLDTKGGYPTSSRGVQRLPTIPSDEALSHDDTIRDEEDDATADRSQMPLLAAVGAKCALADATMASQVTETTCLSVGFTPDRTARGRRRQDSLHSHDDSSLHSLDDSSTSRGGTTADDERNSIQSVSSRSLRGHDDNDTGICHADHQMTGEAPDVPSATAPTSPASSCTSSASLNNNNSINNNSALGSSSSNNNNGTSRSTPAVVT